MLAAVSVRSSETSPSRRWPEEALVLEKSPAEACPLSLGARLTKAQGSPRPQECREPLVSVEKWRCRAVGFGETMRPTFAAGIKGRSGKSRVGWTTTCRDCDFPSIRSRSLAMKILHLCHMSGSSSEANSPSPVGMSNSAVECYPGNFTAHVRRHLLI